MLIGVVLKPAVAEQPSEAGQIQFDGDASALRNYGVAMDEFDPNFNIVTP